MPFDKRLPLVDHILGQLILDRCGPYAFARRVRSTWPTRDAVLSEVNYDLSPQPFPVPIDRRTFSGTLLGELSYNCIASLTLYLHYLAGLTVNAYGLHSVTSPTTLGRGSP